MGRIGDEQHHKGKLYYLEHQGLLEKRIEQRRAAGEMGDGDKRNTEEMREEEEIFFPDDEGIRRRVHKRRRISSDSDESAGCS